MVIQMDELDIAPKDGPKFSPPRLETRLEGRRGSRLPLEARPA